MEQKQEIIIQLVTKMICVDTLPISFIENKGFKDLLAYITPNYKIPCRKTISSRINALYESQKQKLIAKLTTAKYISVTTDCWSSRANEAYITITCHYIGNDQKQYSYNLTTEPFAESHTSVYLKNILENILIEWNIADKCVAIVHDNAANIVGATRDMPYEAVCCFAHSLQLVVNKALEVPGFKVVIDKCSHIVGRFNHSNKAANYLTIKQNQLNLPNHKLIQSVKTRWNSTYYMIKRIIEQR